MPIRLTGNWKKGIAHSMHTLGSQYLGVDEQGHKQWDSTRTVMGELVYQLKYQGQLSAVREIVDLLVIEFPGLNTLDAIIPVPATRKRRIQPVLEVAKALGARVNVPVWPALGKQPGGEELKNIEDAQKRREVLQGLITFDALHHSVTGKNVLLLDDLYRSGATLTVATEVLYQAGAKNVYVLTLTMARRAS